MTYRNIQLRYFDIYSKTIKTCWIADVKRELGLTKRIAHNRTNPTKIKYPCPGNIKVRIKGILQID